MDTDFFIPDVERHDVIHLGPFEGLTQRAVCSHRFVSVHLELAIIGGLLEPELSDNTRPRSVEIAD